MADIAARSDMTDSMRALPRHVVLWTWLAAAGLLSLLWWFGFSPNGDFDDVLKLQKVRYYLDGGGWFDQRVPGILQPEPFLSHWPRLLDLPYILAAQALELFADRHTALRLASFFVPLILLLPALALYRMIVGRLGFERPDAAFVLALLATSNSFFEFAPDRSDYHNVQILFLLAATALTLSRARYAALANGALIALALATSVEFAPLFAVLMAVHAVEFILGHEDALRRFGLFGAGLAVAALAAYPLSVAPDAYGTIACDSYSLPHLLALGLAGVTFAGSALLGRAVGGRVARTLMIALPAAACLGLLVTLFPQCHAGPYGAMGDYLREAWLAGIGQEHSLFGRRDFVLSSDMAGVVMLIAGAAALVLNAILDRGRDRNLIIFAVLTLAATLQGILYFRYLRYLPLFAAPGILLVLASLVPTLGASGGLLAGRTARLRPQLLLAPGLVIAAAIILFHLATPATARMPTAADIAGACHLEAIGSRDWPKGASVMAPPMLGIRMLPVMADASVVAVPFHTGAPGVERAFRFLDPATGDPRAMLDQSRASHVVVCAWREVPPARLIELYPFAGGLMTGQAPDWLVECPTREATAIRVYRYPGAGLLGESCPAER